MELQRFTLISSIPQVPIPPFNCNVKTLNPIVL